MTIPSMSCSDELAWLFRQQISLLEDLEAVLSCEAVALASSDVHEELIRLATDKQRLVEQLTGVSREMDGLLTRADYPADSHGLDRLIAEAPEDMGLGGLRDRAIQALQACLTDNKAIGGLVELRRAAVQRTLRVLFDQADAANLYRPTGRVSGLNSYNLIAEA